MLWTRPRSAVEQATDPCPHHWHVRPNGWACCWCPETLRQAADAPESGKTACARADDHADDSLLAWLPPPRPNRAVFPGGARRRRRAAAAT